MAKEIKPIFELNQRVVNLLQTQEMIKAAGLDALVNMTLAILPFIPSQEEKVQYVELLLESMADYTSQETLSATLHKADQYLLLVQGHVELVKKDSVFIDIGSLVPGNGVEHLISIASIKLMVEADTVFIQIDYRLPLTWQKLKTEKDHFINGEVALREAIEDIVAQVMVAIDTYKRVVPHGC